jgi:hypothetical protein
MFNSKHHHTLTVRKTVSETKEILLQHTLYRDRKLLVKERTDKPLIGKIDDNGFLVISSAKRGVLCVLNGEFKNEGGNTVIEIETRLHRAFLVLFTAWAVLLIVGYVVAVSVTPNQSFSIPNFVLLLVMIGLFRYMLHVLYTLTRNQSISEIENLLR